MNNDNFSNFTEPQEEVKPQSEKEALKMFYMSKKGRKLRAFKRLRRTVTVFLSLVMVIAILGASACGIYLAISDKQILNNASSETASGLEELIGSKTEGVSYILVCGIDNKGEYGWSNAMDTEGGYHADVMAVACVDANNKTVNVIQIPRDMFIGTSIPSMKLNAAYAFPRDGESSMNALRRKLASHLGIPIDHYVTFTVKGFMNVVDALGGIEVNIWQENGITLIDQYDYHTYTIGPGWVTLNGNQASGFVRKRTGTREEGYVLGDPDRLEGQRLVYVALAKKLMKMSVSEMGKTALACYKEIATDMTVDEILGYAQLVKGMSLEDIAVWGVPGQQITYKHTDMSVGLSYYSIHKQEYIDLWNEYMDPGKDHVLTMDNIMIRELHTEAGVAYEECCFEKGGSLSGIEQRFGQ